MCQHILPAPKRYGQRVAITLCIQLAQQVQQLRVRVLLDWCRRQWVVSLNLERPIWRQYDRLRKRLTRRAAEKPPLRARGISPRFRANALELVITIAAEHIEDLLPRAQFRALEKHGTCFSRYLVRQDAVNLNEVESAPRSHDATHGNGKEGMPDAIVVGVVGSHAPIIESFDKSGQIHCDHLS